MKDRVFLQVTGITSSAAPMVLRVSEHFAWVCMLLAKSLAHFIVTHLQKT